MKKKETLNLRVSAEFKRKLAEEAKKERRSLTNYLETALTKLWEQQETEDARTIQVPRRRRGVEAYKKEGSKFMQRLVAKQKLRTK